MLVLTTRLEGSYKIHIEDMTHIPYFPGMLDVGLGFHNSYLLGTNGTFSNHIGKVSVQGGGVEHGLGSDHGASGREVSGQAHVVGNKNYF